ncbi:N-acetylglucosamine kinase [Thermoactinospora rubra]|uniref:N-acetylglucosamine kinase n=1 Tax=Thermoactinospora rubra TaxID=1088767 RepID=UPI000A111691|nr:BadF/BadG/BcrA/BcrD ATPase family protein [Thermoactinospora rubra]
MKAFVLGVDAGSTSTRVAVHALDGTRIGYGTAGPGNPTAHGLDNAVAAIGTALEAALSGVDPAQVAASRAGVAGHVPALEEALAKLWAAHGVHVPPRVTGDVTVAFAAGTASPDGSLLLSGTGAVAARIAGFELDTIADGLGWLLGDAGSGFWIGREATKAVVHALDQGEPGGALAAAVVRHFLGEAAGVSGRELALRIVRLVQAEPMRLAAVSALVSAAAAEGDPAAVRVVEEAAERLAATVAVVHRGGPVVLAGSVLTSECPVRRAVLDRLGDQEVAEVATAADGAGAAAWLAARGLLGPGEADAAHAAFVRPVTL